MSIPLIKYLLKNKFIILFFGLYFLLGLFIYKDYGVSWDELSQDSIGATNLHYVLQHDMFLFSPSYTDKYYGPIYEMILVGIGSIIGTYTKNFSVIFQTSLYFRHLFNFCTFFIGTIFFYLLAREYTKKNISHSLVCCFLF